MGTRRDALLTLPVIWAAARSGRAQQPKAEPPKRIGFLALYSKGQTPWPGPQIPFFFIELGKKGWILGENLSVVEAFADWKREGLAGLAEDLVRKNVDVILCEGVVPALAAARATRTIPIVFYNAIWPLELGLIDSYNRPGRNATGFAFHAGIEVTIKRLTLLRETSPGAKRLSWLWPAGYRSTETLAGGRFDMIPTVEAAAKSLGFETRFHRLDTPRDVDAALGEVNSWRAQAISTESRLVYDARHRIAELALDHHLPSAFEERFGPEAGGLLSYGPVAEGERSLTRIVEYTDRVLRGTPPADLPVERPNRYELVINMKTAKTLGLTIPQAIALRADDLIQ